MNNLLIDEAGCFFEPITRVLIVEEKFYSRVLIVKERYIPRKGFYS